MIDLVQEGRGNSHGQQADLVGVVLGGGGLDEAHLRAMLARSQSCIERNDEQKRKRKRSDTGSCCSGDGVLVRVKRKLEAEERHRRVQGFIDRAIDAYFCLSQAERPVQCRGDGAAQADQSTEIEFDFRALHALRFAVKPKLRLECSQVVDGNAGEGEDVDLFDCVCENPSNSSTFAWCMDSRFLIPPKSRWIMSELDHLRRVLRAGRMSTGFNVVVCDPPWENASARRSRSYSVMGAAELLKLPLAKLFQTGAGSGEAKPFGVVALWMTNRERLWRFVEETLLPHWGLAKITSWYWLKVQPPSSSNDPRVFSSVGLGRHPYEQILLARTDSAAAGGDDDQDVKWSRIPRDLVILSQPTGRHSEKPDLGPILERFLPFGKMKPVELFARKLRAGWTSWGNEVLKFQQV